jgi:hypothetical protein
MLPRSSFLFTKLSTKVAYPLRSEPVCVVVVRDEIAVVEGEREKMPFGSLGLTDSGGMMERGNEVGSGYANACLLWGMAALLSMRDIELRTGTLPFEGAIWPRPTFDPPAIARDFAGGKPSRHIPPGIRGTLLLVSGNFAWTLVTSSPYRQPS